MITVVFDADCGVCQASVEFIRKRDARRLFAFVPSTALPEGVDAAEAQQTLIVLDDRAKTVRAAAVARILRELPRWRFVAPLLRLPGADAAYRLFARHRHRVSAALGLNACEAPPRR